MTLLGGIEAGGTKFVCAVGDAAGNIPRRVCGENHGTGRNVATSYRFFKQHCGFKSHWYWQLWPD